MESNHPSSDEQLDPAQPIQRDSGDRERLKDREPDWFRDLHGLPRRPIRDRLREARERHRG